MKQNNFKTPPKWATSFLRFYCRSDLLEDLEGDLNQYFQRNVKKKGITRAKIVYVIDVLTFLKLYTIRSPFRFNPHQQLALWKNYSVTAIRSYGKEKLHTSINIISTVLGICCFVLVILIVNHEFSFNKHYENSDRIGRISLNMSSKNENPVHLVYSNVQLRKELISSYQEIESVTGVLKFEGKIAIKKGDNTFYEENFYQADSAYFTIFSHQWLFGDPNHSLTRPGCIVLTQDISEKYFKSQNPLGKVLNVNNRDYEITGVIENVPENTDLRFNALLSLDWDFTDWCQTYVLFKNSDPLENFHEKLDLHFDEYLRPILERTGTVGSYNLERLEDIHFGDVKILDSPKISRTFMYGLLTIGFIVLLLSCVNYVNLSIFQSVKKQSQIGIRKVFGALDGQVRSQYLTEAFWITLISFSISIFIIVLVAPSLKEYGIISFSVDYLFDSRSIFYSVFFVVILSILSGFYPAFIISRSGTIKNLRGRTTFKTNGLFNNFMVLIHFTISISLIFSTLIVSKQINLLLLSDPGYNKDQVLVIDIPSDENLQASVQSFRNEVDRLSHVISTSFITHYSMPTAQTWTDVYNTDDGYYWLNFTRVDEHYFELLDLKLVEGRIFEPGEKSSVVVNEALVNQLGWQNPIGEKMWDSEVIGVIQDFNFNGLNPNIQPLQFQPIYRYHDPPEKLLVKLDDSSIKIIKSMEDVWKKTITEYPFESEFLDSYYQQQFNKESKFKGILWYVSLLAILIASIGLFGIVTIKLEYKNKENSLRKIFGARIIQLLSLGWIEYGTIILVSILLSYPITAIAMNKWLQSFSHKTTVDMLTMGKAIAIVMVLLLIIGIYQTIKMIRINPLISIRDE